ncbi:fimbrial protein [Dysgonomonas alginatilytica]|nr:fimbrial protein [Dysgonomonas alginatilytica]
MNSIQKKKNMLSYHTTSKKGNLLSDSLDERVKYAFRNPIKHLFYGLLFIFSLFFSSCQDIDPMDSRIEEGAKIKVTLRLLSPSPISNSLQTRAQTDAESNVQELAILVFENNEYRYTAIPQNINSSGGVTTLNTYFQTTSSPVDIYFLANADDIIVNNPLTIGDSKAAVREKLTSAFASSGINSNFPMFGVYSSANGLNGSIGSITSISLLRTIARIDVDASNVSGNFQLVSIQAFRVNNSVQLIPDSMSNVMVTAPSIPSGSLANIHTTVITPTTTDISSTSQLYLPESAAPTVANQLSEATCVVIGGYFNGSTIITYYRMDFNPGSSANPFGQILRNYQYLFRVNDISLPGAETAVEAANNKPTGITAQVLDWDINSMSLNFQGNYYFEVSSRSVILGSLPGSFSDLTVNTNVSEYTMEWSKSDGTGDGSPSSTILDNGVFRVEQLNGGATIRFTALTENTLPFPFNDHVLISAYGMRILLSISQPRFKVTPNPIIISASGGAGYALVTSSSLWGGISNQSWFSATTGVGDTLKWTATQNTTSSLRTGNLLVKNLDGEQISVPFQQNIPNNTVLNVYSLRSGFAFLGAGPTIGTADARAQGLKGILTRAANFGLAGSVNMNGFNFSESTVLPHTLNATTLANINILYMNLPGAVTDVNAAGATAALNWLNGNPQRVLIVGYDLNTNANMLNALGITNVTYYVDTQGTYPMQFNSDTQYFSNTGPFTAYPNKAITNPFSFRNYDVYYGEINTTSYPNITPILRGPHGNSLLGVDYTRRIVYVGDIDLFSALAGNNANTNNYIQNTTGIINSDASRLIANLWAWVTNTALGVTP